MSAKSALQARSGPQRIDPGYLLAQKNTTDFLFIGGIAPVAVRTIRED
ncbi:MAG: hypothetical protein MI923_11700 [Phycisphaerales bacterium]|nr:hypothetical protein [Phycisphaerales bacterium]